MPVPADAESVPEGQYTTRVYTLLSEGKYSEVRPILESELDRFPHSRAALSLLGYACFQSQDFPSASRCYDQLSREHPKSLDYKFSHAHSLFKAGLYVESLRVCGLLQTQVQQTQRDLASAGASGMVVPHEDESSGRIMTRLTKLVSQIRYEQDDLASMRSALDTLASASPDAEVTIALGCALCKEKKHDQALQNFAEATASCGAVPYLSYNTALCHYRTGSFASARKHILEIVEKGIREHPELGSYNEEPMTRSVGNSSLLRETCLVEAFNLKAAIEYATKNVETARESMDDMPKRDESELDAVTLHNRALINLENDGFQKLRFLLTLPQPPPETFGNLLLLYCREGFYDVAADTLAENPHLRSKYLTQELFNFLEALIMQQVSPEEAYRKFEELAKKHVERLRKLGKQVQDARISRDPNEIKVAMKLYEEAEEKYIPVLMAQAKLYWDVRNYGAVERIFRQSMEFISEHRTWRLDVAHVLYMQERFKEAIRYYEPIVQQSSENILQVPAIVLANLCVSYIMTSQNESAEDLMRKIEKEEEAAVAESAGADPATAPPVPPKLLSGCIVNLVIGTLYSSKGNYEFGISRIMKSLEDFARKLDTDTWFYAKLCFLALGETMAKGMAFLKDTTFNDILSFLSNCDTHGRDIPASAPLPSWDGNQQPEPKTISSEARLLYFLFLKLRGE